MNARIGNAVAPPSHSQHARSDGGAFKASGTIGAWDRGRHRHIA